MGKIVQDSIHVIVLGFSSAIITDEDIRGEFRYKCVSLYPCALNFISFPSFQYAAEKPILLVYSLDALFVLETWRVLYVSKSHMWHVINVGTMMRSVLKRRHIFVFVFIMH